MTASDQPPVPWDTVQAADAYQDRDMRLARTLIFPTVLRRLGPAVRPGGTVLDVGCGTGALTTHVAEARECTVHGLDLSTAMLDIARADRPHPRVHYRAFDGKSLEWIPDGSVDAVVCCLVYCTDPDDGRLAALTGEIHRVLRPGAPYVLADLNPQATGEQFSTLRYGEPGAVYADGDTVPTFLRRLSGTTVTTACHYRSLPRYRALLTDAGFPAPDFDLPLAQADGDGAPQPAETRLAPYMVLSTRGRSA
ncbi:class I SAM-dependent methyltransferase [Streptomyces sp. A012304]|uniref:class I SAM-dependent methyltransferase n=1 Tax=Streptomyces sp. A012304 TaxID=375446 RepID=UPI00222F242F|nr:class I SAM-dependent methyltransferase [Streptomyces sp. A012304]